VRSCASCSAAPVNRSADDPNASEDSRPRKTARTLTWQSAALGANTRLRTPACEPPPCVLPPPWVGVASRRPRGRRYRTPGRHCVPIPELFVHRAACRVPQVSIGSSVCDHSCQEPT
jgi:hypothetical protein